MYEVRLSLCCLFKIYSTRNQTELRLIGHPNDGIPGQRLPSQRQVQQLFSYYHKDKIIHESVSFVAAKVLDFWNRARTSITTLQIGRLRNCSKLTVN